MKFIKNLFLLGITCVGLYAQGSSYFVTNNLAANTHFLLTGGKVVEQIILTSTNAASTLVRLYDGAITNIVGAYTNYVTYTTNVVSTYVNVLGTTNIYTNTVVWNAPSAHTASTNNTTPILVLSASPSALGPATYTFPSPYVFVNRVTLSNDAAGLNVVVKYRLP